MIDSSLIETFDSISLEEMGKVRLMNRVDTKFVTDIPRLHDLLQAASTDYLVQQIDGRSNMPYYTRYYDTADAMMFYQHQRGKKNRRKIRVRHYEECDMLPFVEIKSKNNRGRSHKKRVVMDNGTLLTDYRDFIDSNSEYSADLLVPRIENHFYRITLVDRAMTERITIDSFLEFNNLTTGNSISLDRLGIIEWKRDARSVHSPLADILRNLRIRPTGFSKYCVGMAMTNPDLRQNRLKTKLRMIEKI